MFANWLTYNSLTAKIKCISSLRYNDLFMKLHIFTNFRHFPAAISVLFGNRAVRILQYYKRLLSDSFPDGGRVHVQRCSPRFLPERRSDASYSLNFQRWSSFPSGFLFPDGDTAVGDAHDTGIIFCLACKNIPCKLDVSFPVIFRNLRFFRRLLKTLRCRVQML